MTRGPLVCTFDANFGYIILDFGQKTRGNGLARKGRAGQLYLVELLNSTFNTTKFIQKGEVACITLAWSSGKLSLKIISVYYT